MKQPIPPIHQRPEALKRLLTAERAAQKQQRLQALYLLQTQQARTRLHVARLLGVSRNTVGRWLAAYQTGGIPQMLTMAQAPGKAPLLTDAMREALRRSDEEITRLLGVHRTTVHRVWNRRASFQLVGERFMHERVSPNLSSLRSLCCGQ
jgi:transposase